MEKESYRERLERFREADDFQKLVMVFEDLMNEEKLYCDDMYVDEYLYGMSSKLIVKWLDLSKKSIKSGEKEAFEGLFEKMKVSLESELFIREESKEDDVMEDVDVIYKEYVKIMRKDEVDEVDEAKIEELVSKMEKCYEKITLEGLKRIRTYYEHFSNDDPNIGSRFDMISAIIDNKEK